MIPSTRPCERVRSRSGFEMR